MDEVRAALGAELESRGYRPAQDTGGDGRAFYLEGPGDRPLAIFELFARAEDAFSVYQGHWPENLPARIAVIPESGEQHEVSDLLRQAGMRTLSFKRRAHQVCFPGLDSLLEDLG